MRKSPLAPGFTLLEMLIATSIGMVVLAGLYVILGSSNILTAKGLSVNITNMQARNAMDQMQTRLQTAYSAPVPISGSGVALNSTMSLTGTAMTIPMAPVYTGTTATITGTGAGIKFYRYIAGPYQATIPSTGLAATASSITLTSNTGAVIYSGYSGGLPLPQKYDVLAINTTAMVTGTGYQVWATVSSVTSSTTGSSVSYSVQLTGTMTDRSGTNALSGTAIAYQADSSGSAVTCYTYLLRPVAFLFVTNTAATSSSTADLRMYEPCMLTSGNMNVNVSSTASYITLARNIDLTGSTAPQFSIVTFGGQSFVSSVVRTRAPDYENYLSNKQLDSFSTYMGFGTLIHLKSKP